MARNVPPSLISYTEVAYPTSTSGSIVSASVSWQTNDIIVVEALCENNGVLSTPTATGLTFTSQKSNSTVGTCASQCATAVAASSSSSAITCARGGTPHTGMGIWVWRNSDGVGTSVEQHTTTRTVNLTPTDTHSAYCWGVGDFNAGVTTSVVLTPTPTTTRVATQDVGKYSVYSGNLDDQASSGVTAFGTSGGTVTGPSSIIAVEILGTTTAVTLPPLVMAPQRR